ncbi:hypothetical protein [Ammoniphilus sp. YIM 78166]|uniref:hypothetical protein n=1 Tax=Ammoniphilus sp. YIM 78166 TaxID=1644106 RepID=UPI0010700B90|nr:hypothetical protein [Ammoniphilus sp. YIM 78166]
MIKSKWLLASTAFLLLAVVSYSFLSPVKKPQETPPPEQPLVFSEDNANLDWLDNPEIPAEVEIEGTQTEEMDSKPEVPKDSSPIPSEPQQPKPQEERPAVTTIVDKYKQKFQTLERSYQGKLKGLIQQAKQDYQAVKSGASDQSAFGLASAYLSKVNQMESHADKQFYQLLGKMEQELLASGHPTDIVKQVENEYKARKKTQRSALMQKFTEKL